MRIQGNAGPWASPFRNDDPIDTPNFTAKRAQAKGIFFYYSSVKLGDIKDGTSNTIMFSETAYSLLPEADQVEWHWWTSGNYGDTMFTSFYPVNPHRRIASGTSQGVNTSIHVVSASSNHPGGANVAMCDGSVRFLKDTINSWPFDPSTGLPTSVTANADGIYVVAQPGLGVWQALTTRNGGEAISADQY